MHCPQPAGAEPSPLPADALAARLDQVLETAGVLVSRIPDDRIEWAPAALDASLRDVGFHLFRLGLAFADGMDLGRVRPEWLREGAPPELIDGPSIARYGALVRARLSGWFEGASRAEYDRTIDNAGHPDSGRALLAETARHTAHHLRQLHRAMTELGVAPLDPLDVDRDEL